MTSVYCVNRLTDTQESLESSLIEKENMLAKASEKLELFSSLQESLSEKEIDYKEASDKLLHTEHAVGSASSTVLVFVVHQKTLSGFSSF